MFGFGKKKVQKGVGTAMIAACETGDIRAVLALSDNEDAVRYRDGTGWCPIHYAAQAANSDVLRILGNSNADMNAKTKEGYTAGDLLVSFMNRAKLGFKQGQITESQCMAMWKRAFECFQTLVNFGADLSKASPHGPSPRDFLISIGAWNQN